MKAAFLVLTALLLVGCEDTYRYPCQDEANKDNPECNRPACEDDGICYDTLNGLPPKQAAETETTVEETPAAATADCNNTGE
jgi:hypothetical protein